MTRGAKGSQDRGAASSFLGSRLRAPANPAHYRRRPRLVQLLDESATAPITSVVAPAGSGKTSLLVDWCAASSLPTAWLSLDETDRDGGQFWNAVAAALADLLDGLEVRALSLRGAGSISRAAATVVAALDCDHPAAAVLVLDDVHLVDHDDDIATSLAQFLGSMPDWLHVVLSSRRTPRLPIDRLRARGHLAEVHFTELQFAPTEAEEMLSGLAPWLGEQEVCVVAARARGWAAGIRLSALAARSEKAQPGSASHVGAEELLFGDYVWREVLSGESPAVIDVLLDTSVVKRANSGLAGALTGSDDAGKLLLEAEARGLFITRVDHSGWLEVHDVVREQLLAEASRRSPARVSTMHARAARWFEDSGDVSSALEHWLLAGQPRDALRLLASHAAPLYDTGREATVQHTIAHIPLNVATADLRSMLEFAWCHLMVNKEHFVETVHQATAMVERMTDPDAAQVRRLGVLQSIMATMSGDWARGGQLATQTTSGLGEAMWTDSLGSFGWNMVARDIALSERWEDGSAQLEEVRFELAHDPGRRLAYEGTRALGEALAGYPVDALRIAAGVRDVANVSPTTILRAELDIAVAVAHRELGDRSRAVTELASLAQYPDGPVTHARALAMLELTELRLDEGDLEGAEGSFEAAREFIYSDFSGPGGRDWLGRVGSRVALAAGRLAEARNWADQIEDSFWGGVCIARVDLMEGRADDAAAVLDRVVTRSVRHDVVRGLLRARAAKSQQEAVDHAVPAVELARGSGLVQTVASEGIEVLELLEVNAWLSPKEWLDRIRRAASPQTGGPSGDPSLPGEHLTTRELEVLRMLQSRLTLREIAGELFISVNTLKFHLRIIYRKLGVGSRQAAADQARRRPSATVPRRRSEAARTPVDLR